MYSQSDEERYILEAVGDAPGVFLDIGAYDGKTFSNTAALVDRGWSGVLVEPSTYAFQALHGRYGSNSKLHLVHAAVGLECGLTKFWESRDAVSTTSEKHHEIWKGDAAFENPHYVAEVSFGHLLREFPVLRNVDVLSIDTEGTSGSLFLEVVHGETSSARSFRDWGHLEAFLPKVVVVEYDLCDQALIAYANQNGFDVVYKSNENLVLVHESCRTRAQVSH